NELTVRVLAEAVRGLPPDRKLRIVEIGAGTGGTTEYLLDRLPADRVEYLFTDVGALFIAKAADKFANYPFMKYGLLDIERDPAEQQFAGRQFDVVVAANVLHATVNVRQTLRHVKRLM